MAHLGEEKTSKLRPGQLRPELFPACPRVLGDQSELPAHPPCRKGPLVGDSDLPLLKTVEEAHPSWPPTAPAPTLAELPGSCPGLPSDPALVKLRENAPLGGSNPTLSLPRCSSVVTCYTQAWLFPPQRLLCPFPICPDHCPRKWLLDPEKRALFPSKTQGQRGGSVLAEARPPGPYLKPVNPPPPEVQPCSTLGLACSRPLIHRLLEVQGW